MASALHRPPGRAGRLWLRDRLALARRAVSLLDTKVRLLRRQLDQIDAVAEQSAADWERACRQARQWHERAVISGGARSLQLNYSPEPVDVVVRDTSVMGITYPDSVLVRLPERVLDQALIGSSAVTPAAAAFRRAVQFGAKHAVTMAARAALEREIAVTSQRLRALRDRWIPALEAELAAVESALDELERTDSARLRWARGTGDATGDVRPFES